MNNHLTQITEPLVAWYRNNKRDLPWRRDKEPYHIWISEIMLQQTRIEAVMDYYHRFLRTLPTVEDLSRVSEEELLKLWEGLGYYSRARNLKKAAEMIMTNFGGIFPDSYEQLRKLPGIGEYTAGAIASICYNEKVPAVDGNVLRVISRVIGSRKNVLLPETKKGIENELRQILPEQSGDFNEALMELGETVCLPNGTPLCGQCPINSYCTAYQKNLTAEIPVRIKKVKRRKEEKSVFLFLTNENEIAIEKRTEKGLLSGMYQLPNIDGYYSEKELKMILQQWQIKPSQIDFLKEVKHIFTHIDWCMKGYLVITDSKSDRFIWVSLQELSEKYPLPTAFQKFIKALPDETERKRNK